MNNKLVAKELLKVSKKLLASREPEPIQKILDNIPKEIRINVDWEARVENLPDGDIGKFRAVYRIDPIKRGMTQKWELSLRQGDHNKTGNIWKYGDMELDIITEEVSLKGFSKSVKFKNDMKQTITWLLTLAIRDLNDKDVNIRSWKIAFY